MKENNQVLQDTMESTFRRRSYLGIQRFLARTVSRIFLMSIQNNVSCALSLQIVFCKEALAVLWTGFECVRSTHFLFHYLPSDFKSWDAISFRGKDCNTSGVLNTKICHVIICISHHFCVSENFDMHPLKQVYLYVICVDLCGLNQVQNFCIGLDFRKP